MLVFLLLKYLYTNYNTKLRNTFEILVEWWVSRQVLASRQEKWGRLELASHSQRLKSGDNCQNTLSFPLSTKCKTGTWLLTMLPTQKRSLSNNSRTKHCEQLVPTAIFYIPSKRELFKGDLERACPVPAGKIVAFVENGLETILSYHWLSTRTTSTLASAWANMDQVELSLARGRRAKRIRSPLPRLSCHTSGCLGR